MFVLGAFIHGLARALEACSNACHRVANFLNNFLPALLPPARLDSMVHVFYGSIYQPIRYKRFADLDGCLELWEEKVLDQYRIRSGRILILGAGDGREALAIARRGVPVVGVDFDLVALGAANTLARSTKLPVQFLRADYFKLPLAPGSFECALLSSWMYSAIPGRSRRQAWVAAMAPLLKLGGHLILSFMPQTLPMSRLGRWRTRLNTVLARMPGANPTYQPGDVWRGHLYHAFRDEAEIREELSTAGMEVLALDWARGFAVVTASGSSPERA